MLETGHFHLFLLVMLIAIKYQISTVIRKNLKQFQRIFFFAYLKEYFSRSYGKGFSKITG